MRGSLEATQDKPQEGAVLSVVRPDEAERPAKDGGGGLDETSAPRCPLCGHPYPCANVWAKEAV